MRWAPLARRSSVTRRSSIATDAPESGYLRPSDAEFERRRSALAELLAASEVDALLVYGNDASRHDIRYLTAWPPGWDTICWWLPGTLPRLYLPSPNHVPGAAEMTAGLADARDAGADMAATVAADLRGALPRSGERSRVGTIGPIPAWLHRRLVGALEGIELVDVGVAFRALRLVKSEEELAWTRRAAALCDEGIAALVEAAGPGVRDDELVAVVEHAYRRMGGEHGICFLASAPMTGGGRVVPSVYPSRRVVRAGDAISIELSAGIGGVTGQVLRTVAVGDEVPAAFRRIHEVADAAFAAIAAAIKPGASAADLLTAAALIDDAGLTVVDDVVHGYGGGYLPPVTRTPATQSRPVPDLRLEPGMLLVVQPNVVDREQGVGVQTGELLAVTARGHERLHSVERGLLFSSNPVAA